MPHMIARDPQSRPEPLSPERLAEIRSMLLGDWHGGEWRTRFVDGDSPRAEVLAADGTVLAVLPDWAHAIATFVADAHDAVPQLLAEVDRLKGRLAELERPAIERKRNEIRQSYMELAAQAREDRDYEGAFNVECNLRDRESQWKAEDAQAGGAR